MASAASATASSRPKKPAPVVPAKRGASSQEAEWVAQEDAFVLNQAMKKAAIRVRGGRARPIDWLAVTLRLVNPYRDLDDDGSEPHPDLVDPERLFDGLTDGQLLELDEEIDKFLALETKALNRDFWNTMKVICRDRRQKAAVAAPEDRAVSSVAGDVDRLLAPKTLAELEALERQIKAKLDSNEPIDVDYWERLLRSLTVWKARAKLKDIYRTVRERQRSADGPSTTPAPKAKRLASARSHHDDSKPGGPAEQGDDQLDPGASRFAAPAKQDFSHATDALFEREVARGVNEDEEIFAGEEDVAAAAAAKPQWASKHRPRKPRYFNRVQMGYEWNKYNQTHYDHDNPPPKVVQGYKFNIFYPDLIDKSKGPSYRIERENGRKRGQSFAPAGEEDTCLIRFVAGPPYEDIAFRIVDKEWDYSAKRERGFKSTFDKGILQLHFQFKKIYYRK